MNNLLSDLGLGQLDTNQLLLRPEFDAVLFKVYILWNFESDGIEICEKSLNALNEITAFSRDIFIGWQDECESITTGINWDVAINQIYFFKSNEELTFEFIQLRDWLIWIGCPMSLVWRISAKFHLFESVSTEEYQYEIRNFVFESLRGFVSSEDFSDLEFALFGDSFGAIIQRMIAFRGFRLAGISRAMCEGWFNIWTNFGFSYDIIYFTNWDFDSIGFTFPESFEIESAIVLIPKFRWSNYFVGRNRNIFLYFENLFSLDVETTSQFAIAINSLPTTFTTRLEYEFYFI